MRTGDLSGGGSTVPCVESPQRVQSHAGQLSPLGRPPRALPTELSVFLGSQRLLLRLSPHFALQSNHFSPR